MGGFEPRAWMHAAARQRSLLASGNSIPQLVYLRGRMLRKENRRIWRVLQLQKAEFGGGGGGGVSTEKPEKGSNPSRTSDILMARMKRSFVTRGGAEVESTAKQ